VIGPFANDGASLFADVAAVSSPPSASGFSVFLGGGDLGGGWAIDFCATTLAAKGFVELSCTAFLPEEEVATSLGCAGAGVTCCTAGLVASFESEGSGERGGGRGGGIDRGRADGALGSIDSVSAAGL